MRTKCQREEGIWAPRKTQIAILAYTNLAQYFFFFYTKEKYLHFNYLFDERIVSEEEIERKAARFISVQTGSVVWWYTLGGKVFC